MDGFVDRMERLTIKVASPDRAVRATYTVRDGLAVELAPGATAGGDDRALGASVTAAVDGVLRGYHQVVTKLLDEDGVSDPWDKADPKQVDQARAHAAKVADISVSVASGRNVVKAEIAAGGGLAVRIRPGTLRRLDLSDEQLEVELNQAVTDAMRELSAAKKKAFRETYAFDQLR